MFVRKLLWFGLLVTAAMLPLAGCGGSGSGGGGPARVARTRPTAISLSPPPRSLRHIPPSSRIRALFVPVRRPAPPNPLCSDVPRVHRAGLGNVLGSGDDRSAVREHGELTRSTDNRSR